MLQNGCAAMEIEVKRKVVVRRKETYVVVRKKGLYVVVCRREVYVFGEKEEVECVAWCVCVSASSAVTKCPRRTSYADWTQT